jgi:molybdopterin converting factor small subunit
MSPTFQILYFASASSYTRKQTESLPAPLPVHKLFDLLEEKYPGIREKVLASCAVSVGLEYVDQDVLEGKTPDGGEDVMVIREGEEVAIIPPVSSG